MATEKERVPATELEWLYTKVDQFQDDIAHYRAALSNIVACTSEIHKIAPEFIHSMAIEGLKTKREREKR